MSITDSPRTGRPNFGRRGLIVGAAAIGFAIGGYSLASAAQGAFTDDNPSPTDVSVPATDGTVVDDSGVDTTADTTADTSSEDTTVDTVDDNTGASVEDASSAGDDHGTDTSDDQGGDHGGDQGGDHSTTPGAALPDPFTKTYDSVCGSITVTWNGTAFSIDSIDPAAGFTAQIDDQQWDRVRVEFKGSGDDSRIEVRISDDGNTIHVVID